MPEIQESTPIQALYQSLSSKQPQIKERGFDGFVEDMKDDDNSRALFESLSKQQPEIGKRGYDGFKADMFGGVQEQPTERETIYTPQVTTFGDNTQPSLINPIPTTHPDLSAKHPEYFAPKISDSYQSEKPTVIPQGPGDKFQAIDEKQLQKEVGGATIDSRESLEDGGFGTELGLKAQRGANALNQMLVNTPNTLIRLSNMPFNYIYKAIGLPEIDKDSFNKMTGLDKVDKNLDLNNSHLSQRINWINPKSETSLIDAAKSGDWSTFGRNLAGAVVENMPTSIAIMAAAPAIGATASTLAGSAIFGSQKLKEIDKLAPNMPEPLKLLIGYSNGALEGFFESTMGSGAVAEAMKKLVLNEGKEVAKEAVMKGFRKGFSELFTKYPLLTPLGEGYEEWATQVSQNYIDKVTGYKPKLNMFDGALENAIIGIASGSVHSLPLLGLQTGVQKAAEAKYKGRIQKFVDNFTDQDGNIQVTQSPDGIPYYIHQEPSEDGRIVGTSTNGESVYIDPKWGITSVKSQEVFDNIMKDGGNKQPSKDTQTQNQETPQLTVDPRQAIEATFRQMGEEFAHKETGLITVVQKQTPGTEENIPMFVVMDAGDGSFLLQDDQGNREWSTKEFLGQTQEMSVDDFTAMKMAELDQNNQQQELLKKNQIQIDGIPYILTGDQTNEGYVAVNPEDGSDIVIPANTVDNIRNSGKQNANIVKQVYGKTNVTGIKNEDGSLTVSGPATEEQANSLKSEVEAATGGKATVQAELIPNEDATAPQQFQLSIIPKVNTSENNESVIATPSQDNGLSQNGQNQPAPTDELFSQPTERKVTTQLIGKDNIDFVEGEDFDEVVPTDKMPLEKALPILEKKFKDHPKVVVVAEKVQVEVPGKVIKGETKWDDDVVEPSTFKTVIKSIKIVPKEVIARQKQADTDILLDIIDEFNATPQSRSDKQKGSEIEAIAKKLGYQTERTPMNEIRLFDNSGTISRPKVSENNNSENANSEKVPEIKSDLSDTQQGANQVDVKSSQKSQLQNKESEKSLLIKGNEKLPSSKIKDRIENIAKKLGVVIEFKKHPLGAAFAIANDGKFYITIDPTLFKNGLNNQEAFNDLNVIAHELGHAIDAREMMKNGLTDIEISELAKLHRAFVNTFNFDVGEDVTELEGAIKNENKNIRGDEKGSPLKNEGDFGHEHEELFADALRMMIISPELAARIAPNLLKRLSKYGLNNSINNEKPLESNTASNTESGIAANEGENTPQAQQGQGNEKGLEENVNSVTGWHTPKEHVTDSFSHVHMSPHNTAKVEEAEWNNNANELQETIKKYVPEISDEKLNGIIDQYKADYLKNRESVWNAASNSYSSAVAGRSNFNAKQADQRGNALDRAEERFSEWNKKEIKRIEEVTGVAKAKSDEQNTLNAKKQDHKQAVKIASVKAWMALKPGDKLDVGNSNGNPTITKKNKFSVETGAGTKWTLKEIYGIDHAEAQKIMDDLAGAPEVKAPEKKNVMNVVLGFTYSTPESLNTVSFEEFQRALARGEVSVAEFKKAYEVLKSSKETFLTEMNGKTKAELLKGMSGMGLYRYKNEVKDRIIKALWDDNLMTFAFNSISYDPFSGKMSDAIDKKVAKTTQKDIEDYVAENQKRRNEYIARVKELNKGLNNPETLTEFKIFIDRNGIDKLSPEQKAAYDNLVTDKVIDKRNEALENKAVVGKVDLAGVEMDITETKHTKTGADLFVVKLSERVSKEDYQDLNSKAKQLGGYYSSFRGQGAVPGFQFKTREQAQKFVDLKKEDASNLDLIEEKQDTKLQDRVSKLRDNAQKIIDRVDTELSRDRLTNTAKRASQAASTEARLGKEKQIAQTMMNIADAIENGDVKLLDGIKAKTHIELLDGLINQAKYKEIQAKYPNEGYEQRKSHDGEPATVETVEFAKDSFFPNIYAYHIKTLVSKVGGKAGVKLIAARWDKKLSATRGQEYYQTSGQREIDELTDMVNALTGNDKDYSPVASDLANYNRLKSMGIENDSMLRAALREYVQYRGKSQEVDKVKKLERALVGRKNIGIDFFPTPKETAQLMVDEAGITEGMDVLEPSAGNGNIADAIKETGVQPDVIELSSALSEVLEAKGYDVVASDFMDFNGKKYDRIVMNPPFSNGMDGDHVIHAYDLLKPGGKLVAIVGEGTFIRNDKKAVAFREWLDEVGGTEERLNQGTFQDKTLLNTTGANARMVVIEKPEGNANFRILGETGAANLDKAEEVTTRLDNLVIAREMEKSGKDTKSIRLATGWEKGVDGKWRYEVPDSELKVTFDEAMEMLNNGKGEMLLSDMIDDKELFDSYPKLKDTKIYLYGKGLFDNTGGTADASQNYISIGLSGSNNQPYLRGVRPESMAVFAYDNTSLQSVLSHEVQRLIQFNEGFNGGGTVEGVLDHLTEDTLRGFQETGELAHLDPETKKAVARSRTIQKYGDKNTAYRSLSGEVESRNVQTRINMTPEERRNALLSETEDVAREDQIVLMEGFGVSNLEGDHQQLANDIDETFNYQNEIAITDKDGAADMFEGVLPADVVNNIRNGNWKGGFTVRGKIIIHSGLKHPGSILSVLVHEKSHIQIRRVIPRESDRIKYFSDVFTRIAPNELKRVIGTDYSEDPEHVQAEEYYAHLTEELAFKGELPESVDDQTKKHIFDILNGFTTLKNIQDVINTKIRNGSNGGRIQSDTRGKGNVAQRNTSKNKMDTGTSGALPESGGVFRKGSVDRSIPLTDVLAQAKQNVQAKKSDVSLGEKPNDMDNKKELSSAKSDNESSIQFESKSQDVTAENKTKENISENKVEVKYPKEDYDLTRDEAWKFEYDLTQSLGLRGTKDYHVVNGDTILRIKGHTPNWSNFIEDLEDNPNIKRVINVTVGDYNNSDFRRNKTSLDEIEKEYPNIEFADIQIEDGESIFDNIDHLSKIVNKPSQPKNTILINGVSRSTLNSNGKPIANSEEGIRNFWKWFGDSKVVDGEGRPLVVYHGTNKEFSDFIPSNRGIWLTPDEKRAEGYAMSRNNGEKGITMPLYAKIENISDYETNDEYVPYDKLGYDGWGSKKQNGEYFTIVVKSPSQIKSATGNNGSFSPETNDIRFKKEKPPIMDYMKEMKDKVAEKRKAEAEPNPNPNKVRNSFDRFRTLVQDNLQAVKNLQEKFGLNIIPYSNVYFAANQKGSKAMGMMERWEKKQFKPVLKVISQLEKETGANDDEVSIYINAAHSPERNKTVIENHVNDSPIVKNLESIIKKVNAIKITKALKKLKAAQKKALNEGNYDTSEVIGRKIERRKAIIEKAKSEKIEKTKIKLEKAKQSVRNSFNGYNDNFSGFTTNEANKIIKEFEGKASAESIKNLWEAINEANDRTSKMKIEYGLTTQEQYDKMKTNGWKRYVPKMGWRTEEDDIELDYEGGEGKGELKGMHKMKQRGTISDDPIANMYNVANSVILMGEKNKVSRTLWNLIRTNPGRNDLFEMAQVYYMTDKAGHTDEVFYDQNGTYVDEKGNEQPDYDISTFDINDKDGSLIKTFVGKKSELQKNHEFGMTSSTEYRKHKEQWKAKQHEVRTTINGRNYTMILKDPAVANAINGENTINPGRVLTGISKYTRFKSKMVTTFSPYFVIKNTYRDLNTAINTTFIENGAKASVKFIVQYPKAAAFMAANLTDMDATNPTEVKWKQWYDEYNLQGSRTGHSYLIPLDDVKADIKKKIAKLRREQKFRAGKYVNPLSLLDAIAAGAEYGESIARFTAYTLARSEGKSIPEATNAAKNITTNFDVKGAVAPSAGSIMMFFNARVQGATRQLNLAKHHPYRYAATVAARMAMGFMLAALWDMMNPDDDEKDYKGLGDYTKHTNNFIGFADDYVIVPLAQGFRLWNSIGVILYEVYKEKINSKEAAIKVADVLSQEMSPVDMGGIFDKEGNLSGAKMLGTVFSVITPATDWAANENFMNRPIYKEPFTKNQEDKVANSQMYGYNTNFAIRAITDANFKAGGGNPNVNSRYTADGKEIPWYRDINPTLIEHTIKGATGGPLPEMFFESINLLGAAFVDDFKQKMADEESRTKGVDKNTIPLINQFFKSKYTGLAAEQFREIYNYGDALKDRQSKGMKTYDVEDIMKTPIDQRKFAEEVDQAKTIIDDMVAAKKQTKDLQTKKDIDSEILKVRKEIIEKYSYLIKEK